MLTVRSLQLVLVLGMLLIPVAAAHGHGGSLEETHGERATLPAGEQAHADRHVHWNVDPVITGSLILVSLGYAAGLIGLWRRAGVGHGVARWQAGCFAGGVLVLVVALISPIDPISDQLGSVHMIQHMLLMMVGAPLLVVGTPMLLAFWALPMALRPRLARFRRRVERWRSPWYLLWQPVLMWSVFAGVLWIWHLPRLYEAALHHERLHDLQHLAFFVTACLFWRVLLDPLHRLRLSMAGGLIYLFTASLHATLLGVFMALSPQVWYETYVGRTSAWGLGALEDQQVAGLIMWMPACMMFALVAMIVCWLWLAREELRDCRPAASRAGRVEAAAVGEVPV